MSGYYCPNCQSTFPDKDCMRCRENLEGDENKMKCFECGQDVPESKWLYKQNHSGEVSVVTDEIVDEYGCGRHI